MHKLYSLEIISDIVDPNSIVKLKNTWWHKNNQIY